MNDEQFHYWARCKVDHDSFYWNYGDYHSKYVNVFFLSDTRVNSNTDLVAIIQDKLASDDEYKLYVRDFLTDSYELFQSRAYSCENVEDVLNSVVGKDDLIITVENFNRV